MVNVANAENPTCRTVASHPAQPEVRPVVLVNKISVKHSQSTGSLSRSETTSDYLLVVLVAHHVESSQCVCNVLRTHPRHLTDACQTQDTRDILTLLS